MKRTLTLLAAGNMLATFALAQVQHYRITDLGPVGPAPGEPNYIAGSGLAAGSAGTSDDKEHAVLWLGTHLLDLGAERLGGPNSQAFGVNDVGQVVGEAQTAVANGEDFCGFTAMGFRPSETACRPFIWQNGMIAELRNTLGGANAVANLINNVGQVAGIAETNLPETGCPVNQFKPVIWSNGNLRQLRTYGNDPDGGAFSINNRGQAVGATGSCAPFNPNSQVYLFESHAVLWDADGSVRDLGSFGGTGGFAGNHACSINSAGHVVGHSDAGGDTTTYGFLWTPQTGLRLLAPYSGDFASLAISLNDRGDVVGSSFDASFNFRAVIWHNGVPADLNKLVAGESPLYLQLATSINPGGVIVGIGQTSTGDVHGFAAIPAGGSDGGEHRVTPPVPSERALRMLLRRGGIRRR